MSLLNEMLSTEGEGGEVGSQGEVSFSDLAIAEVGGQGERASDMIEHAEKAQDVANGLNHLAEKADELVAEDREHAADAVSMEGLHREFGLWMTIGNQSYKATSFENEVGTKAQARGLAKDCRRIAMGARAHSNEMLDYSPEGAIMQFLGRDASRMNSVVSALAQGIQQLEHVPAKNGHVLINFAGLQRVLIRQNTRRVDLKKEYEYDEKFLSDASGYVSSFIDQLTSGVRSGNIPTFDVSKVSTANLSLLGNHQISQELKYSNNVGWSGIRAVTLVGVFVVAVALTKHPLPGAVAVGVTSAVMGGKHGVHVGDASISTSIGQIVDIAKALVSLRKLTETTAKLEKGSLDSELKKLKGTDKEAHDRAVKELNKAVKANECLYDHAKFLMINLGGLVERALEAIGDSKIHGDQVLDT